MQERAQQCACQLLSGGRGLWPQATALDAAIVSYYEVDKGGDSKMHRFAVCHGSARPWKKTSANTQGREWCVRRVAARTRAERTVGVAARLCERGRRWQSSNAASESVCAHKTRRGETRDDIVLFGIASSDFPRGAASDEECHRAVCEGHKRVVSKKSTRACACHACPATDTYTRMHAVKSVLFIFFTVTYLCFLFSRLSEALLFR